jgi:hypothetical protein
MADVTELLIEPPIPTFDSKYLLCKPANIQQTGIHQTIQGISQAALRGDEGLVDFQEELPPSVLLRIDIMVSTRLLKHIRDAIVESAGRVVHG